MRFIQIDEEGYFVSSGVRLGDEDYGRKLLSTLTCEERVFYVSDENGKILVEAFDEPLIVRHIEHVTADGIAHGTLPYSLPVELSLQSFHVDKWDRFHARTSGQLKGQLAGHLPAVLSRSAQMELFDLADEFDDDSITFHGVRYLVAPIESTSAEPAGHEVEKLESTPVNSSQFWTDIYNNWLATDREQKPGWELGAPAEPLKSILPQIKIPRSRICVLGCGTGNDASYFAAQGHVVTGVDFSETAISEASSRFLSSANVDLNRNLKFVQADAFEFSKKHRGEFDLVFEHAFFCAIAPTRRSELIDAWARLLSPGGHLLAIFFILDRARISADGEMEPSRPPYGATEWELRELLKSKFDFLYWTRWHHSIERRLGRELVVYAQKK